MKERDKELKLESHEKPVKPVGAFDLWKHLNVAKAQKTGVKGGAAVDSMLAVYKDRLTYTFILDREVASIHFDRMRGEIFFKGHNIRNMELTARQKQALEDLKAVLMKNEKGRSYLSDYSATLAKHLADNK